MEFLTAMGIKRVYDALAPRKIVERVRLGEPTAAGEPPRLGARTSDVRDAFFEVIEPPRLSSEAPLRSAVARGIAERAFGYVSFTPFVASCALSPCGPRSPGRQSKRSLTASHGSSTSCMTHRG